MLLGKPEIERRLAAGDIIIDTFKPENLGTAQYDVSIGENYYRERAPNDTNAFRNKIYNPFDEKHVRAKWELHKAMPHPRSREMPLPADAVMPLPRPRLSRSRAGLMVRCTLAPFPGPGPRVCGPTPHRIGWNTLVCEHSIAV